MTRCGDLQSAVQTTLLDEVEVRTITLPVLILEGANDAVSPPPAGKSQQMLYTGSHDVTQVTLVNTGHALTLGFTAATVQATAAEWVVLRRGADVRATRCVRRRR